MIQVNDVGVYGKLPAHGDFIHRDLPSAFINKWDEWLQSYIANSQQDLGEHWLDIYLTSPIWRFATTDGIFDRNSWAGIIVPSVDRVGRYFPFCIATKITKPTTPLNIIQNNQWFEDMEQLAMSALGGQLKIEQLIDEINNVKISCTPNPFSLIKNDHTALALAMSDSLMNPAKAIPVLFDAMLRNQFNTYSLWSTARGSNLISPLLAICQGLPSARHSTALLDGNWDESGWSLLSPPSLVNHSAEASLSV